MSILKNEREITAINNPPLVLPSSTAGNKQMRAKENNRNKGNIHSYNKSTRLINEKKPVSEAPQSIWMLTTYPPKQCGIATFSNDLLKAVNKVYGESVSIKIAAIETTQVQRNYPPEVKYIFNSGLGDYYSEFTSIINNDPQIKALVIQHEFGLFPEPRFQDFVTMLNNVTIPVMLVMHTVIPSPSPALKKMTRSLANAAARVIVMTNNSAALLESNYDISSEKIGVIAHGTHLPGHVNKQAIKEKLGLQNRTVLGTFGLIGRNKNIEISLKALSSLVGQFPEITFLVLGCIHPEVFKNEGDAYLKELEEIVQQNNLQNHVKFINHYLTLEELLEYLHATDIYLFTSKDRAQAVSGTFVYALSAGCAIVSTPIPHARELLENGTGLLFDFENPESLSKQILKYLENKELREETGRRALEKMAATAWENSAIQYINCVNEFCKENFRIDFRLPPINTSHLEHLTSEKGIYQFGIYSQPDASYGYTIDDNARALIAAVKLLRHTHNPKMLNLAGIYLKFIKDCQKPDGTFFNYMNDDGSESDQNKNVNLEDSNGRAAWALGYITSQQNLLPASITQEANIIFQKALPNFKLVQSPRAIAFIIKGLYYSTLSSPFKYTALIKKLADKLVSLYKQSSDKDWKWFEPYITYANSLLPEALLIAYELTSDNAYGDIAKESFDFLLSKIFSEKRIRVISNKGWLHKGQTAQEYGEQPIDVAYTILTLDRFYRVYKKDDYAVKLKIAFSWFLGNNHLNRIVYNSVTGGCYDGIEEKSVNLNQGAESTVSYLMARSAAEQYYLAENAASPRILFQ